MSISLSSISPCRAHGASVAAPPRPAGWRSVASALAGASRVGVAGSLGSALGWGVGKLQQAVQGRSSDDTRLGMGAEARRAGMPKSLAEFKARPMVLAALGNFAKRVEHSPENVPFLLAVDQLMSQAGKAAASGHPAELEAVKRKLLALYDKYVGDAAPLQVNLPSKMRGDFEALRNNVLKGSEPLAIGALSECLEAASQEIWKLLSTDTLRRFEASPQYADALLREAASHAAGARAFGR